LRSLQVVYSRSDIIGSLLVIIRSSMWSVLVPLHLVGFSMCWNRKLSCKFSIYRRLVTNIFHIFW
jgi:hypothetical protein